MDSSSALVIGLLVGALVGGLRSPSVVRAARRRRGRRRSRARRGAPPALVAERAAPAKRPRSPAATGVRRDAGHRRGPARPDPRSPQQQRELRRAAPRRAAGARGARAGREPRAPALAPVKQSLTEMQAKVTAARVAAHLQHGELVPAARGRAPRERLVPPPSRSRRRCARTAPAACAGETAAQRGRGRRPRRARRLRRAIRSRATRATAVPTWSSTCPAASPSRSTPRCRSTRTSRPARSRPRQRRGCRTARGVHEAARPGRPRHITALGGKALLDGPRRLPRDGHRVHPERVARLERRSKPDPSIWSSPSRSASPSPRPSRSGRC